MDKVTQTIDSCIGVIKGINPFVPPASLRCICNALVQPHFNYCVVVWEKCGETLSDNLPKLQKRNACIVTFSKYDADAECLLERLGWKDLIAQRHIQEALMVFKAVNSLALLPILYVYGTH